MISLAYDKNFEILQFATKHKKFDDSFVELHKACLKLEYALNTANKIREEVAGKVEVVNTHIISRRD